MAVKEKVTALSTIAIHSVVDSDYMTADRCTPNLFRNDMLSYAFFWPHFSINTV